MTDRIRVVTFARLARSPGQASIFERDFVADVQESIAPHLHVTRYGRAWRFSRPQVMDDRFLAAKLGFERLATEQAVSYDEELQDFVLRERPSEQGNFSHFVLDLEERLIAFEERPPDIRRQSFLGAFRALLRESPHAWSVEPLADPADFRQWLETVDRIVRFRAVLRRPNPEWRQRTRRIRELLEPTAADEVELVAKVSDPQASSLHVEDTILEEAVEHASSGYARIGATGVRGVRRPKFDSERKVQTAEVTESPVDDSETIFGKIINVLRERLP